MNFAAQYFDGGLSAATINAKRLIAGANGPSASFRNAMAIPESKPRINWTNITRGPGSAETGKTFLKEEAGETQ
jgi:hypothetical protein